MPPPPARPLDPSGGSSATPPQRVRELCHDRHRAIGHALDQLTNQRALTTIAVIGARGLGKSRVVTALGSGAAARGMTVIPLQTGERYRHPLSTVLSGLGDLRPLLEDEDDGWGEALDALTTMGRHGGLLLTIDDAHLMDRESARFLTFVHRSVIVDANGIAPLVATAMAVPDVELLPDSLVRRLIKGQRTNYLELEPLNQTDLAELVGEIFAEASAPIRSSLARDLMRRSEGHPSVLDALIPLVDRSTFTIDLGPPPSSPGAIEAVIAEANRSAVDGSFRDAVEKLNTLNGIPGIDLNPATRTLLANSLYRIGAYPEADRIADDLVADAVAQGDHQAALEAATLGLPEAELHEGSEGRAARLLTIDPTGLATTEERFHHAVVTARQLILIGRADEARSWYQAAKAMATSADHRAAVFNLNWYLTGLSTSPQRQVAELEDLLELPDLSERVHVLMTEHLAISQYEAGNSDEAAKAMHQVGHRARAADDSVRWWHHLGFLNLLAFEKGDWTAAEQHRIEAVTHAKANAIADGEHLYLAQKFNEAWVKGEHAIFAQMMDRVPPEIVDAWFGRVARVEALRAAGLLNATDNRAVRDDGINLVRRCIRYPSHRTLPTLAYLSRFIATEVDEPDRLQVLDLLAQRSGSMLLLGAGVASFGPVDRYRFHISGEPEHLTRAIEVADAAAVPLWQVLLRVEYQQVVDGNHRLLARQAETLSTGTDLATLLPSRP